VVIVVVVVGEDGRVVATIQMVLGGKRRRAGYHLKMAALFTVFRA